MLCCAVGVDPQPNGPTPFSPAVLRDSHPLRAGFTGLPGLCGRSPRQGPLRRPCPRLRLRAAPAPSLPPLTAHPRRPQLLPMAAKGFAAPAEPNTQGERPCTATTDFPTFSLCRRPCKIHLAAPTRSAGRVRVASRLADAASADSSQSERKKAGAMPRRAMARSSQRMSKPAAHNTACSASPSAPLSQQRFMP